MENLAGSNSSKMPSRYSARLLSARSRYEMLFLLTSRTTTQRGTIRASATKSSNPVTKLGQTTGKVECRERLDGVLRYYYCDAA